uniref:Uncharacterized protein MANES_05G102100 n=1 Tax=Rhizophora mucronata TaxID=61149 RepID=A0A2P2JNA1_RHIMU
MPYKYPDNSCSFSQEFYRTLRTNNNKYPDNDKLMLHTTASQSVNFPGKKVKERKI